MSCSPSAPAPIAGAAQQSKKLLFLKKKKQKKTFYLLGSARGTARAKETDKVFWFFFIKKNRFLKSYSTKFLGRWPARMAAMPSSASAPMPSRVSAVALPRWGRRTMFSSAR